jgi:co-chaperonin GroES (HSP10)
MIKIPREKVAVVPLDDPDTTPSGRIIIPEVARERTDQGIVKYIGAGVTEFIKPGMHVLFSGYSGTLTQIDGEGRLIILHQDFIIAELPDPPQTEVPGLYFKGADGEYFQATYEYAMEFVARAIKDAEWFRHIKVKTPRPTLEEYNKMRGG